MILARNVQTSRNSESSSKGVIYLRTVKVTAVIASRNHNHSIVQERCRVELAGGIQVSGGRERPSRRVVQLRAGEVTTTAVASSYQNQSTIQKRRCMKLACCVQVTGICKSPSRWIVQFRTRKITTI